ALVPEMTRQGSGSLVFTSSTASLAGYEHLHEFSPAKAGTLGLMRGLAAEFARAGVRSNAVAYGNVSSPATYGALTPDPREATPGRSCPEGRLRSLRPWPPESPRLIPWSAVVRRLRVSVSHLRMMSPCEKRSSSLGKRTRHPSRARHAGPPRGSVRMDDPGR